MKRISTVLLLVLLVGFGIRLVGCGARVEVAKKKALEKIDGLLGSMDVKREEISQSMKAMKEAVDGLRKAEIKAQVKSEQIDRRGAPARQQIEKAEATLAKLRDYLEKGEPTDIAGKTYSPSELKEMAEQVIKSRTDALVEVAGYEKSTASLQKVITSLKAKRQQYEGRISQFESTLAEIDSQSIALKAMQEASAQLGDSELSLLENVDQLEDTINDLFADVQVGILSEDAKWDEASTNSEIDAVGSFIEATQESGDVLDEIDAILGHSE